MWVLGAFSFAVIGLLIYGLIDLQKKNFHPQHLVSALEPDMDNHDLESASSKLRPGDNCLSSVMAADAMYVGSENTAPVLARMTFGL